MSRAWADIVRFYRTLPDHSVSGEMKALAELAAYIGERYPALFGWTSIADLLISQTDNPDNPLENPHLRIAPLAEGNALFTYVARLNDRKPWQRTIPTDQLISRFERFLDELHWVGRVRPRQ